MALATLSIHLHWPPLLVLGLSLLVRGRVPAWLGNVRFRPQPGRSFATGLAWVIMPCGLLHAALLLSALSNSPVSGGLAMAAFATTSTLGLAEAPAWIARLPPWGALAVFVLPSLVSNTASFHPSMASRRRAARALPAWRAWPPAPTPS